MAGPIVDILMYHSVSQAGGATSIAPDVFAMQMQAIADAGVPVITLDDLLAAREGGFALAPRSVILTFDDGFQDFADAAWPVMARHGFRAIVYLPTGYVGCKEGWRGIGSPPRRLMGWDALSDLSGQGVAFGSHTHSHPDLTSLDDAAVTAELVRSRRIIEDRLGSPVRHIAPPYGLADARVRRLIGQHYRTSVSTVLASAGPGDDPLDLPRVEMFYFTDPRRWRAHLAGRGAAYLRSRRILRAMKARLMKPWSGI